ncbi:hypothetical protein DL96DRAFT_477423 [Flagelloscypha sp. PMI_526]|nr:hypothetical protein DL96DRAFT_477423 [Flagelloscypha sp. PMI_526]
MSYSQSSSSDSGSQSTSGSGILYQTPATSNVLTFKFVQFNPDITNCSLAGPDGVQHPAIFSTDNRMTIVQNFQSELTGTITWTHPATVELPGLVSRQSVRQWLSLTRDKAQRTMVFRGHAFTWRPSWEDLCLYDQGTELIRCQVKRTNNSLKVQIDTRGIPQGLVECIVVAIIILQSGRRID